MTRRSVRRPSILAILASAGLCVGAHAPALAQPARTGPGAFESLTPGARIDAARARVGDESLSGEQRLEAMRDLADALEERLERAETPAETRLRDAVELAESIVASMTWEGLTVTAAVGVMTPSMREQASASSQRALRAGARYDALRADAPEGDPALDARAALARARAGVTLALTTDDQDARRRALAGAGALRAVPTLLRADDDDPEGEDGFVPVADNAEAEAQRLILLGHLSSAEARAGEALAALERAAAIAIAPRSKAEATLGAALALAQVVGPDEARRRLDDLSRDPAWRALEEADALGAILLADARRRLALRDAEFAQGDALLGASRRAGDAYLALATKGVRGAPAPALRALLIEKAASSGGAVLARLGDAPLPAGAFERAARAMSRERGPSPADAGRALRELLLEQGAQGVRPRADSIDALGPFASDALWRLGAALSEAERDALAQRDACVALLEFASRFPTDPRAPGAFAGATAAGQRAAIASPADTPTQDLYERTLRAALAGAADADPQRTTAWRFELGRMLASNGRDADADAELTRVVAGPLALRAAELRLALAERSGDEQRVAQRAADLERAASGATGPDAREALERARGVRASAEVRAASREGDAQAAMRAASRLADADAPRAQAILRAEAARLIDPLAAEDARGDALSERDRAGARVGVALGRALAELSRTLPDGADRDKAQLARALRLTGEPNDAAEGAAILEGVMARAGRSPDLLADYAEALLVAKDQARAFGAYRELSTITRPEDLRTRAFHWLAWGRMLEILAAQNADGARSQTIRAQVERLRLVDPDLGGQPHRQRIERALEGAR